MNVYLWFDSKNSTLDLIDDNGLCAEFGSSSTIETWLSSHHFHKVDNSDTQWTDEDDKGR